MFCLFKSIFLYFAMLFRCLRFFFFFSGLICFFLFKSFFLFPNITLLLSLSLLLPHSLLDIYIIPICWVRKEKQFRHVMFFTHEQISSFIYTVCVCVCVIVRKVHTIRIFTQHFIKILNEHDTTKTKCASDIAVWWKMQRGSGWWQTF